MAQMMRSQKKITSVGDAGNFKGVYYTPETSMNLVDVKNITDKNCTVTFDEDEVVFRNKSTGKILIRDPSKGYT